MKKLITILIVTFIATPIIFGQTKKTVPKPAPKPTPTDVTKPSVQPTPNNQANKYPDLKITFKQTMEGGAAMEVTNYSKGVRERIESKMILPEGMSGMEAQMMAGMSMPITLSQCDLKQDVTIGEKKKSYFIDYYDWSGLSPEQLARRPVNKPIVIKGTMTIGSTVEDSGKRQQMFGYEAKWLKFTTTMVSSADSCEGAKNFKMVQEGWFVKVSLENDSCKTPRPPVGRGGCMPKMILKSVQNPGFFVEGTMKAYENDKLTSTGNMLITALSKAPLDQALFEIPKDYKEVDSFEELMPGINEMMDTSASTVTRLGSGKAVAGKTVAIDFFSGNASKVNQDELRSYLSSKLSSAGMNGFVVNSQADISSGNFVNIIGVELKKIKESGGAKIGGLFGKVTGNSDAAKIGDSEAEIVITIYSKDSKTVVATNSASVKLKGSPNDAVKGAIDKIISDLLVKIK